MARLTTSVKVAHLCGTVPLIFLLVSTRFTTSSLKRFFFIKENKVCSAQPIGVRFFQSVAITHRPFIGTLPPRLPVCFTSSPSASQRAFYQWNAFGVRLLIIFAFRLLIPGVMALSALRRCVSACGSCQRAAMTHVGCRVSERMLTWLRSDGWIYGNGSH